jgi:hypothetical protein
MLVLNLSCEDHMITFARVAMRASMMLVTLFVTVVAFLAAQTPFQHVTVALFIFLYCASASSASLSSDGRRS